MATTFVSMETRRPFVNTICFQFLITFRDRNYQTCIFNIFIPSILLHCWYFINVLIAIHFPEKLHRISNYNLLNWIMSDHPCLVIDMQIYVWFLRGMHCSRSIVASILSTSSFTVSTLSGFSATKSIGFSTAKLTVQTKVKVKVKVKAPACGIPV